VRNKFLGTGEPGYHPLRKLRTVCSGLRFAVLPGTLASVTDREALVATVASR